MAKKASTAKKTSSKGNTGVKATAKKTTAAKKDSKKNPSDTKDSTKKAASKKASEGKLASAGTAPAKTPSELREDAIAKAQDIRGKDIKAVPTNPVTTTDATTNTKAKAPVTSKIDEQLEVFAKWVQRDIVDAPRQYSRADIQDYIDKTAHKRRTEIINHPNTEEFPHHVRIQINGENTAFTVPALDGNGEPTWFKTH